MNLKTTATVPVIQLHLENLLKFIQPYLPFVNSHMVNYLTDSHWCKFIPKNIQSEILNSQDITDAIDLFWNYHTKDTILTEPNLNNEKFKHLIDFLKTTEQFRLDNLCNLNILHTKDELYDNLYKLGCTKLDNNELHIKEFMTGKKCHEVETTAHLVATICSRSDDKEQERNEDKTDTNINNLCVIDAGDGKGYLSSRLALEYGINILGIDANRTNTEGAQKRYSKLQKAYDGLTKRADDIKNGIIPPRKGKRQSNDNKEDFIAKTPQSSTSYQTTTHFITPQTDFVNLFGQYFPNDTTKQFCLTGLHTCGNLATSCHEIFVKNQNISCLCNIGCCYHLLDEEFHVEKFYSIEKKQLFINDNKNDFHAFGFPMSNLLQSKRYFLGRNARMLAAQSLKRTISTHELPNKSLFYRSLLEILILKNNSELKNTIQVGRIKKFTTFSDYIRKCMNRVDINVDHINDLDYLNNLLTEFEYEGNLLNIFYLLRMTFAPILEAIILLDRILYLKESGIENVFLVKLFDEIVSPRCYGIVALK